MSLLSKCRLAGAALILSADLSVAAAQVPGELEALLDEYRVPVAHVGLYVESLDEGRVVASLNPRREFNPASVIKLLPSLAALEVLSPSYRWSTDVYTRLPPTDGVLEGNLYLRGGGDPYLTVESVWVLLKSVRARGIRRIAGDIVVDESVFDLAAFDRGAFDDKPYRVYNGPAGGLMMNFWAVRFTLSALADSVHIDAFPDSEKLNVVNRVGHSSEPCNRRNRHAGYRVTQSPDSVTVTFHGKLSRHCRPIVLTRAVIPAERYAAYVLPGLWRDAGGTLDGVVRKGPVPDGAERLYTHPSRSLAEVVQATNKFSNNLMARHLLITLGSRREDRAPGVAEGVTALRDWLLAEDIEMPGLHIDNGSGLSRDTRVTALGMANLMRAGYRSRYAPEFLAALPIAGRDRAMAGRDVPEGERAIVRMKTGLIDHVRALAAYITTERGETYAAVLLINHPGAHRGLGTRLQNALIRYVLEL